MFAAEQLGPIEWLEQLARLARELGKREFEAELMALLNLVLPIDHCVVFTYSGEQVGHLFTQGKMPAERAAALADDYIKQYHSRDPLFSTLSGADAPGGEVPLDMSRAYDQDYRTHFFDPNGLVDKMSAVGRVKEGSVLCNFYRMRGSGSYSADERERLHRILPLLTALIAAHYRLARNTVTTASGRKDPRSVTRSLVHTIIGKRLAPFDRLTQRECEVCERIILGYTSVGIALDLHIGESSVLTYRKRAYEKLGIATLNELFALCIEASQR
ncbi:LuxR family transcriptional regulator [Steroidobacter sp.]|uniref:LuxR family transcriptional regulator n=1 Tax=Steroidobacter sp. TaxID=1978227 RepID=UPI001A5CFD72|nr:helix-turn-helix transcriptional regulator [Steroidobacter sp.]MBL8271792.1 helix-turn-helix transcriptional regulator [Steroidobacter sp.]